MMKTIEKINLSETTKQINVNHTNFVLDNANDHCVRIAVFKGEYQWHHHPDSDEIFMVIEGQLLIDLENDVTLEVNPNEIVKIPAGVLHRTRSNVRTVNLCFEREEAETVFLEKESVR